MRLKASSMLLAMLLVLGFVTVFFFQTRHERTGPAEAELPQFDQASFRAHMGFLADDLLQGRGTATRGHEIASKYIATQFELLALSPAGERGTFFQSVPLREISVNPEACQLTIFQDGHQRVLKWGDDFIMRGSALLSDVSVEAPV